MQIISGQTQFNIQQASAVAIGKFDGVHRGHRELLEEILAAKKEGLMAVVFTFDPSGSYESSSTMREIEESLSELGFFRASKWYLINLAYVDSYRDGELVLGGTALSVSRARRRELFEALNAYWGEVMK